MEYLGELNTSQREAVLHKEGPMIIIAGAGSGKTRVITYRIAHLMKCGIDPFNMLILTFTNKAAREMKSRIANLVGQSEAKNLWMGTFHSIFARILRTESDKLGYPPSFTIYDTQDSVGLIGTIIKEKKLDKQYKTKEVFGRISSFKNSLITVRVYQNDKELKEQDAMRNRPKMGDIYEEYVNRCFRAGAMDFDDLLLKTNELLSRFPDVLAKYQDKFRYVMVDEYQDTNHSQYLIMRALVDRFKNICVVGDDSQSIYAFRGADIHNILKFQEHYDNAKLFKLEQNYRSSENIVGAANSLIKKNKIKIDKKVWTSNGTGPKIKIKRTISDGEEGRWVANSIFQNKMNHQLTNDKFCVLYRTNAQSRSIEDALRKKGIAHKVYGGISFYQRKEVKDVLAYLRILINPSDEEALKRIINYPPRGIGQTTIDKLIIASSHYKKHLFEIIKNIDNIDIKINEGTKRKLKEFANMIQAFTIESEKQNAFDIASKIVKKIQIVKYLKEDGTSEGISKSENVHELLNGIKYFIDDAETENTSLASFLEEVILKTDLDNDKGDNKPMVYLMTIHLSKGLEYPYVYIVGLEESLFPSVMNIDTRSGLEEERRLFYVALTRAEQQVYLSFANTRYHWGRLVNCEPSRFIEEIDPIYLEYLNTGKITHSKNNFVDSALFQESISDTPKNAISYRRSITANSLKIRYKKKETKDKTSLGVIPKGLKPLDEAIKTKANLFDNSEINVGNIVEHNRFGKGKVIKKEGKGNNTMVEIKFENNKSRKIILKFVKLKLIKN